MSRRLLFLLVAAGLVTTVTLAQDGIGLTMRDVMSPIELQQTGINRLTAAERGALDGWLNRYTARVLAIAPPSRPTSPTSSSRASEYAVEASVNDETFIINGEIFKAKTYCFGIDKGDHVIFLEGSPNGVCVSATFVEVGSGRECRVWCE